MRFCFNSSLLVCIQIRYAGSYFPHKFNLRMLLYIIKQYFQRNIKYELNIFIQEANELKLTDDL